MFDLPRKVREFSCLCCGERFWTIQGDCRLFDSAAQATAGLPKPQEKLRHPSSSQLLITAHEN